MTFKHPVPHGKTEHKTAEARKPGGVQLYKEGFLGVLQGVCDGVYPKFGPTFRQNQDAFRYIANRSPNTSPFRDFLKPFRHLSPHIRPSSCPKAKPCQETFALEKRRVLSKYTPDLIKIVTHA